MKSFSAMHDDYLTQPDEPELVCENCGEMYEECQCEEPSLIDLRTYGREQRESYLGEPER